MKFISNKYSTFLVALICFVGLATPALARPAFLEVFTSTYKQYEAALSERSCANCHVSTTNFKLNPYGKQIAQAFLDAGEKKLTPAILQKVETLDANGDGISNLDEIKAGKSPGEARPVATPSAAKEEVKTAEAPPDKPAATGVRKTETINPPQKTDTRGKPPVSPSSKPVGSLPIAAKSSASTSVPSTAPKSDAAKTVAQDKARPAAVITKSGGPKIEPASAITNTTAASAQPPAAEEQKPVVPKNAYHPAIVHFPIALFIAGLLLDFAGIVGRRESLLLAGWYNLILAALSSVTAIITGIGAMLFQKLPFSGLIPQHMLSAVVGALVMWMMVALRVRQHSAMTKPVRVLYFVLAVAGLALISYSGHLGGQYVYGE
jgi:uncharacterized membrane protein